MYTLARVDVLCVDKTGTITENTMKVMDVIETDEYDSDTMDPLRTLLSDFSAAMTKDNITMAAMKEYFTPVSHPPQNTAALLLRTALMYWVRRSLS